MSVVAVTEIIKLLKSSAITKLTFREAHGKKVASQRAARNAKRCKQLSSFAGVDSGQALANALPAVLSRVFRSLAWQSLVVPPRERRRQILLMIDYVRKSWAVVFNQIFLMIVKKILRGAAAQRYLAASCCNLRLATGLAFQ